MWFLNRIEVTGRVRECFIRLLAHNERIMRTDVVGALESCVQMWEEFAHERSMIIMDCRAIRLLLSFLTALDSITWLWRFPKMSSYVFRHGLCDVDAKHNCYVRHSKIHFKDCRGASPMGWQMCVHNGWCTSWTSSNYNYLIFSTPCFHARCWHTALDNVQEMLVRILKTNLTLINPLQLQKDDARIRFET